MVRTILVVDDSQVDRGNLERVLSGAGYQVSTANDGEQALATIAHSRPDLVMMDVNMPVMDGFAATRALRDAPETKDLPVVLVTSKGQKADKAWGKMLGAKGHITKPYSDDEVLSVVRAI